jgi:hypothetical protein
MEIVLPPAALLIVSVESVPIYVLLLLYVFPRLSLEVSEISPCTFLLDTPKVPAVAVVSSPVSVNGSPVNGLKISADVTLTTDPLGFTLVFLLNSGVENLL